MTFNIITCPQWRARQPKQSILTVGQAKRIIIHHTDGHHPEISVPADESRDEAVRYARDIQHFHQSPGGLGMKEGGSDSGHNFLVCRNGLVLQGRWGTVTQIQHGQMVRSAHCPGQNDQVGIEHEHVGVEEMTDAQRAGSAALIAWISRCYHLDAPLPLHPHREYFRTLCPVNLADEIPQLTALATELLAVGV